MTSRLCVRESSISSKLLLLLALSGVTFLPACDKDDDPVDENEEELITTVTLTLIGTSGPVVFTYVDLDGDGGTAPTIQGNALSPNRTYAYTLSFLNATEAPAEDITVEVREEGTDHQVFFQPSSGLNLTAAYSTAAGEVDANSRPIGLAGTMTTGATSTGNLKVILRHEPNKGAAGVSNGDITNADGETDVEVDFPVTIR